MNNRIKELRKEKKMTQIELANIIGIKQNTLSYWEKGTIDIDSNSLRTLANFFGVSIDYLLSHTDIKDGDKSFLSDNDIKFALWGDVADQIPDEKLQEVKNFAQFIKDNYRKE